MLNQQDSAERVMRVSQKKKKKKKFLLKNVLEYMHSFINPSDVKVLQRSL